LLAEAGDRVLLSSEVTKTPELEVVNLRVMSGTRLSSFAVNSKVPDTCRPVLKAPGLRVILVKFGTTGAWGWKRRVLLCSWMRLLLLSI
jgi:hypothetical protein